jgi:molybdenum cofactor cytidylyltransferase
VYWAVHHAVVACHRVIVVLGHQADAVREVLPHWDHLIVVTNPEYRRGMLTSIARGAAEVETSRFFVAPADMPFLLPGLFNVVALAETGEAVAAFPSYGGQNAHPVLIGTEVVPALVQRVRNAVGSNQPLGSMRSFLADYQTQTVPVDDDGSIVDIDTMETLRRYADRAREHGS